MKESISVKSIPDNTAQIVSFFKKCCNSCNIEPKFSYYLCVAGEEVFLNIAKHAYEQFGEVSIECEYSERTYDFSITFIDNGKKFNPMEIKLPTLDDILNKNVLNGIGWFVIKNLVDEIKYEYQDNKNKLTIIKNTQLSSGIDISHTVENEICIIKIKGRIDTQTSSNLDAKIKEILKSHKKITFDLVNVDYISSCGLRSFLSCQKTINQIGGEMIIKNISNDILEIFQATGFTKVLHIT